MVLITGNLSPPPGLSWSGEVWDGSLTPSSGAFIEGGGGASLSAYSMPDADGVLTDNSGGRTPASITGDGQPSSIDWSLAEADGDLTNDGTGTLITGSLTPPAGLVVSFPGGTGTLQPSGSGLITGNALPRALDWGLSDADGSLGPGEEQPFLIPPISVTEWHPSKGQSDDPQRWVMVAHYDPDIEFPNNDRPWIIVHDGGGFATDSGKISADSTPTDYTFNVDVDNIRLFRKLYQAGWVIFRAGYHSWDPTNAPGYGLFWKDQSFATEGSGNDSYFRLDSSTAANDYDCAERDFLHQVQWIRSGGTNIPDLDLQPGRNGAWGKSAGGLVAAAGCLSINRADPNAAAGSRYGIDTRMGFFINQSSALTYDIYIPGEALVTHFPNASGTGVATLVQAKQASNTNAGPLALRMSSPSAFVDIDDNWRAEVAGKPMWLGTQDAFVFPNGPWDYDSTFEISDKTHPPEGAARVVEVAEQAEAALGIAPPTYRFTALAVENSTVPQFKDLYAEQQYLVACEGSSAGVVLPTSRSIGLESAGAAVAAVGGLQLSLSPPVELVSDYKRAYDHLHALVFGTAFRRVRQTNNSLSIGPETVEPATLLLNETGAEFAADRRNRRTFQIESTHAFQMILEFDAWVDLGQLDAKLQKMSGIFIKGAPETGVPNRYLLVRSKQISHPKVQQSSSGTRAVYELTLEPYLA